jgi:hypothetical protein
MTPPPELSRSEVDEIRLCWGCLERFAHFALVAEAEYQAHVMTRAESGTITIDATDVAALLRRIGGSDASAA